MNKVLLIASLLMARSGCAQQAVFEVLPNLSSYTRHAPSHLNAHGSVVLGTATTPEIPGSAIVYWASNVAWHVPATGGQAIRRPLALSAEGGAVAGVQGTSEASLRGLYWTPEGGSQQIGPLGSDHLIPVAIDAAGTQVMGQGGRLVGLWTLGTFAAVQVPVEIPADPIPNMHQRRTRLTGVSADCSVITGYFADRTPYISFRYSSGVTEHLPGLSGSLLGARATHLSADGSVMAGIANPQGGPSSPVIWPTPGSISAPLSQPGIPTGLSADGSVIVGNSRGSSFVIRENVAQTLTGPLDLRLTGISADGQIITGHARRTLGSPEEPLLHLAGQFHWLSDRLAAAGAPPGEWQLTGPCVISSDGTTFAGSATANGEERAYRAVLPR
jgi:hypothetical protein